MTILRYAGYQIFCLFFTQFSIFVLALVLSPLLSGSVHIAGCGFPVSQFITPVRIATRLHLEPLSPNLQLPGKGAIGPDCRRCLISHYNHVDWCRGRQFLRKEGADPKDVRVHLKKTILRKQRIAFSCGIQYVFFIIKFTKTLCVAHQPSQSPLL